MQVTNFSLNRRSLLHALAATGASVGLAGCSGGDGDGSDGSDDGTNTDQSDGDGEDGGADDGDSDDGTDSGPPQAIAEEGHIKDTFEDGDYMTELEWDVTLCEECAADVTVVEQAAPDGGSRALRLEDADDNDATFMDGPEAELTEAASFSPDPWTVEGQFYVQTLTETDEDPLQLFIDVGKRTFIPQGLESHEPDVIHFKQEGASYGVEEKTAAPALEEGGWYEYTISHDGSGTFTAARHDLDADGNRTDSYELSITTEAPLENENISLRVLGGTGGASDLGENPIAIDHSFVEWTDDSS